MAVGVGRVEGRLRVGKWGGERLANSSASSSEARPIEFICVSPALVRNCSSSGLSKCLLNEWMSVSCC